uniref:UDP-glycosyltransferase n=1 Tax=Tetranychus urticae TaxID=32264 RepID=T1KVC2_TETUR
MATGNDKPLKILFTALFSPGHLNACLGIGLLLKKRGHQVYVAHLPKYRSLVEKHGFEFISLFDYAEPEFPIMESPPTLGDRLRYVFESSLKFTPLERLKEMKTHPFNHLIQGSKGDNYAMMKIVKEYNPDVCLADYLFNMPWMFAVDCPVIPVKSLNPIDLYNGPPPRSGCSVYDSPTVWEEFRRSGRKINSRNGK